MAIDTKHKWATLIGSIILAIVLFAVCTRDAPDFATLREDARALITALEEYKTLHGRYPESINGSNIALPSTRWGRWRYRTYGGRYELAIGDYMYDGFVLYYSPTTGWHLDQ